MPTAVSRDKEVKSQVQLAPGWKWSDNDMVKNEACKEKISVHHVSVSVSLQQKETAFFYPQAVMREQTNCTAVLSCGTEIISRKNSSSTLKEVCRLYYFMIHSIISD